MQTHEKDIYDLEVERLKSDPDDIFQSWNEAKPLFRYVGRKHIDIGCGCLTMIRNGDKNAFVNKVFNQELTKAIESDKKIPNDPDNILISHLPRFAKWQRRIDRMNAGESFEEVMKEEI